MGLTQRSMVLSLTAFTVALASCSDAEDDIPQRSGVSDSGAHDGGRPDAPAQDGAQAACVPKEDEGACVSCTKQTCCTELERCSAANPNCECVLGCIAELQNPVDSELMTCASDCGLGHEAMTPLFSVLGCWGECASCPNIEPAEGGAPDAH